MEIKMTIPKYAAGDIIHHKTEFSIKRKILYVISVFYDETGISNDNYYQTVLVGNNDYPPSPMSESAIDKYYTIF
jgi:hypothetical protein